MQEDGTVLVDQAQLAGNRCAVIVIAAFDHQSVFDPHHGAIAQFGLLSCGLKIPEAGPQDARVNAGIAELNGGPFTAVADNDVFDFAQAVGECFAPTIVVVFVGVFSGQFFLARDILDVAIIRDDFRAAVRIAHAP